MNEAHLEKAELIAPLMQLQVEKLTLDERKKRVYAELGIVLRRRRSLAGLSTHEMARRMGFSAQYVSAVELGRRPLTIAYVDTFLESLAERQV